MTDVKPVTDYMVGSIQKAHRHCSTTECGDVLVLLARVDADREEIASVRKAAASKDRLIEQQAAEIAALKAEVETVRGCLHELAATVRGEAPSLLNEDSGGDAFLSMRIDAALGTGRAR